MKDVIVYRCGKVVAEGAFTPSVHGKLLNALA